MALKFVTLMEGTRNVHLMKDVGQIPYQLHKMFNVDSYMVTFNCDTYTYLENEVKGLKIDFLPLIFGMRNCYLAVTLYLLKNAKKIDVLNLYHLKKRSIIYGLIYLLFNSKGKLYYKFDCPKPEIDFRVKKTFLPVKLLVTGLGMVILRKCTLLSVETQYSYANIKRIDKKKLLLVPNAFDDVLPKIKKIELKTFEQKDDVIVLVGKHGDNAKNSELILNALPLIHIGNWKIRFVGACSDLFKNSYTELLKKYPEFEKNILLDGYVSDKTQLFQFYNDAKIICLPSRSEGFPNVISEAIYFGAVPVLTDHLPASWDLTDNGNAGLMFKSESPESLANVLNALISDTAKLKQYFKNTIALSRDKFVWKKIVPSIYERIVEDSNNP